MARTSNFCLGGPSLDLARHDPQPPLDAAAVTKRRRRRFLDRDQQVAAGLVAVPQLGQLRCAAKQLERRQPALALVLGFETERIAGLELKLPLDRLRAGANVAGNQYVIDEDARRPR